MQAHQGDQMDDMQVYIPTLPYPAVSAILAPSDGELTWLMAEASRQMAAAIEAMRNLRLLVEGGAL